MNIERTQVTFAVGEMRVGPIIARGETFEAVVFRSRDGFRGTLVAAGDPSRVQTRSTGQTPTIALGRLMDSFGRPVEAKVVVARAVEAMDQRRVDLAVASG